MRRRQAAGGLRRARPLPGGHGRRGADLARMKAHARAGAALRLLLEDVFDEQTDFELRRPSEHARPRWTRLEQSTGASASEMTLRRDAARVTIASDGARADQRPDDRPAATRCAALPDGAATRRARESAEAASAGRVHRRGRRMSEDARRARARGAQGSAARAAPVRRRARRRSARSHGRGSVPAPGARWRSAPAGARTACWW